MKFTINLATKTYLDHRRINLALLSAMFILLVLLLWNIITVWQKQSNASRLKSEIIAHEATLNSRPAGVSENEFKRLLNSIVFFNAVIERKTFNWLNILDQLELVTPEGVALSSLTPDSASGELKIEGRSRNFAQVTSYLEKLEESGKFRETLLLSHRELALGERIRGVEFTISCRMVR
ncbi:MAG: hypothetical protein A2079_00245 [Geobacteraceae bacterium GWC2_48_7]|nr:MAG: hypothetical protein A2079_00245 [Geobacteraceae bacterium GWC2_48_7]